MRQQGWPAASAAAKKFCLMKPQIYFPEDSSGFSLPTVEVLYMWLLKQDRETLSMSEVRAVGADGSSGCVRAGGGDPGCSGWSRKTWPPCCKDCFTWKASTAPA